MLNTHNSVTDVALAILLLLPLGCSAQTTNSSTQGCPAGLEGLFPDPTSCNHYFECRFNDQGLQSAVRQLCPNDLPYFQPTIMSYGYCARRFNVGSGAPPCRSEDLPGGSTLNPITIIPPYTGNTRGQESFSCPRSLIGNRTSLNGLYADPTSCTRYYQCIDYQAYQLSCPDGMLFSDTVRRCDYPSLGRNNMCNSGVSSRQLESIRPLLASLLGSAIIVSLLSTSALNGGRL